MARLREVPTDVDAANKLFEATLDPKWEVRKVAASALAMVPEAVYLRLVHLISKDKNVLVRRAVWRSIERRTPPYEGNSEALGAVQKALARIEAEHGTDARNAAFKLADRFAGLHLRSAVHDIKNILTSFGRDAGKATPRIQRGYEYLRRLANAMHRYSEDLNIVRRQEDIGEIIRESLTSAVDQVEKERQAPPPVEIHTEVEPGLMGSVSRYHLVMTLTNLIKNAIESHAVSAKEWRAGRVTICAKREEGDLVMTISDTGSGIEPGDLMKLLEFIPGESSKAEGSGYGLPTGRRYMKAHGGTLDLVSASGKGTTATIRIPESDEDGV